MPITVWPAPANGGLPAAQRRVLRGRYVFALDADDLVYPDALRALGPIRLGARDVVHAGTLSTRPERSGSPPSAVDPDLLVHGAFMDGDVSAPTRRTELGGYADDDHLRWEDYDLWLTVAEHRCSGHHWWPRRPVP